MPSFNAVGVLSLLDTLGERNFKRYIKVILQDLHNLQDGGINAILIENDGDTATSRRAFPETVRLFTEIMDTIQREIRVPYLVGVLPADYESSFDIAKRFNAFGVWMDTLVDRVSPNYTQDSFIININPEEVVKYKNGVNLFAEVQPRNFYELIGGKNLEQSVKSAKHYADAICLVGEKEPLPLDLVKNIRKIVGESYPIGVSGGLSVGNIASYTKIANFGIFFSYLREDSDYKKRVDIKRVRTLMNKINKNKI
ncbi:hypothetical protein HYX18_04955 [Candidatus Woesearchaeota archaeon]|nr:hypothetical protein [Candidatus Woesearchaeota archaeon]